MDLIFPLGQDGELPGAVVLGLAVLLGIGFGAALERGGLGDGRKLSGQFYLRDLTVFKVMFTAIVTAMLGLYWLEWVGLLDRSALLAPPTYVVPQLIGGLVFGAGFVMAGYCPGTSCVAGVSGRIDGVAALVGMLAGMLGFGELYPLLHRYLDATPLPDATLPGLLHLPGGVVAGGIALIALGLFKLIEGLEAGGAR
jgi:hypothetical protein